MPAFRGVARGLWIAAVVLAGGAAAQEGQPAGARLYQAHCASCHGSTGTGDGPDAVLFVRRPPDLHPIVAGEDPSTLARRILAGAASPLAVDRAALRAAASRTEALVSHLERLGRANWPLVQRGEALYADRCAACHGPFGQPAPATTGRRPADLSAVAYQAARSDDELLVLVRHGRPGMPPLPRETSTADAQALVAYLRLLSPGYATYQRYCASCHGADGHARGGSWSGRPTVVFDRRYFAAHDTAYVRARVWHMTGEEKPAMPHFGGVLTEAQARLIVAYLASR
ncbi:MAG TPA: c-type cytochrome [Candidatus Binatia bacterium]|nr:c-type cytochrome [Candidatus Binatia bacterium]